jgi:hypothetical protein
VLSSAYDFNKNRIDLLLATIRQQLTIHLRHINTGNLPREGLIQSFRQLIGLRSPFPSYIKVIAVYTSLKRVHVFIQSLRSQIVHSSQALDDRIIPKLQVIHRGRGLVAVDVDRGSVHVGLQVQ